MWFFAPRNQKKIPNSRKAMQKKFFDSVLPVGILVVQKMKIMLINQTYIEVRKHFSRKLLNFFIKFPIVTFLIVEDFDKIINMFCSGGIVILRTDQQVFINLVYPNHKKITCFIKRAKVLINSFFKGRRLLTICDATCAIVTKPKQTIPDTNSGKLIMKVFFLSSFSERLFEISIFTYLDDKLF